MFERSKKKWEKQSSLCLYLDEVIDVKFIKPSNTYALICSNSESLKLLELGTNLVELYNGHDDIILCLDLCPSRNLAISGSKDNKIRLWKYDLEAAFNQKLRCLAVMEGHSENISGLSFSPKKSLFFTSVG